MLQYLANVNGFIHSIRDAVVIITETSMMKSQHSSCLLVEYRRTRAATLGVTIMGKIGIRNVFLPTAYSVGGNGTGLCYLFLPSGRMVNNENAAIIRSRGTT